MNNDVFVQPGDLIIFDGKHKLYCGDCKNENSYSFIEKDATLCFTSPPYNVGQNNYGSTAKAKTEKYLNKSDDIKDDKEYEELLLKSTTNSLNHAKYVFYNITHNSGNKLSFIKYMYEMKDKYVDTMVWVKPTTLPVIEPNVMNSDFEYILVFTNMPNNGKHIRIGEDFRGNVSNVIECERNSKNEFSDIHKALFPIKLCDYIIETFTEENDIVLDCFSGLGTNMISCMKNNRIYRGIEISPYYCQETINRYLKYKTDDYDIKIIRDGKTIDFENVKAKIINEYNLFTI